MKIRDRAKILSYFIMWLSSRYV